MNSDASVLELAAFIKVCSLCDYQFNSLQNVHNVHYPIKAFRLLIQKIKSFYFLDLNVSKFL